MVLSVAVCFQTLIQKGKKYLWQKPQRCPKCGHSDCLWGHGYVLRYFEQLCEGIYMKRWRCRLCRTVLTTRPTGFWKRVRDRPSREGSYLSFPLTDPDVHDSRIRFLRL